MYTRRLTLGLAALVALALHAVPVSPRETARYFEAFFDDPSTIPVAFAYNDVRHEGLGGLKVVGRQVGPIAPVRAGSYALCANFRALNVGKGSVDISAVRDGKILWQAELVRNGKTYVDLPPLMLKDIVLAEGQTLELVVGPGLAERSYTCDGTGITLTVVE